MLQQVMEAIEYPNRRLKIIQISGAKGVDYTVSELTAILLHSQYHIGEYKYVAGSLEQSITFNGQSVPSADLEPFVAQVQAAVSKLDLGAEWTDEWMSSAVALQYFARESCPDFVIWHTNFGGQIEKIALQINESIYPVLTIVTDLPKAELAQYAAAVRPGVSLLSGVKQKETIAHLDALTAAVRSNHYALNRDYRHRTAISMTNDLLLHFEGPYRTLEFIRVASGEEKDMWTTTIAIMAAELLRQSYAVLMEDDWHQAR
ncbi:hypothetical protein ACFSTH_10915 [Paenibacillus yanchengensis]|uniref:Uncharacterized protein n=1 Tax=Paenibacillus yanchengensis TaxID=2035833 RepID=A0ABW4YJD0_9BACL